MSLQALLTAIRFEARLFRRDHAAWLILGLLVAAVVQGMVNGREVVAARERAVQSMRAAEAAELNELVAQIEAIESGQKAPASAFRDPRNAFAVANRIGPTAALPPAPLAFVAVGASEIFPPAVRVRAGSKDSFLFADEIANPIHLKAGIFDLAFVFVFVLPICLLALTYNLVSGEREQGTFALNASSPASLVPVFAGKLIVRGGIPLLSALAVLNIGIALSGTTGSSSVFPVAGMLALSATVFAYGVFWLALAAFVNALRPDSTFNALALIAVWLGLVMVIPAIVAALAESVHPAPPRAEIVLAARSAAIDIERDRAAEEARYREEHGETATASRISERDRGLQRIAVQSTAAERTDAVIARHDARVAEQAALATRLSFLSPALLVEDAIVEMTGNGRARQKRFEAEVTHYHRDWRRFFINERAEKGVALTRADYDRLPHFVAAVGDEGRALPVAALSICGLAASIFLGIFVLRLKRRSE